MGWVDCGIPQGSQVVKATVCKTVYRWFESSPWDHVPLTGYAQKQARNSLGRPGVIGLDRPAGQSAYFVRQAFDSAA